MDLLRPIYQERASHPDTLGVIIATKRNNAIHITDTFDNILLIVVKNSEVPIYTKHYLYDDQKTAMHIISEETLYKWIYVGSNRKIIDWIVHGKILFERNEYLHNLRTKIQDAPILGRKIKMGIQYSKLIRRYLEARAFFNQGDYLDAYNYVIKSLHHLARLSVIDNGLTPEITVWSQIKKLEPEIYKLYEELVMSHESLEKRLELLLLAIEFLVNSKTKEGAQHILEIMAAQENWTIQQLHNHKELRYYSKDLEVFIEYLIEKGCIQVNPVVAKSQSIYHRNYKVNEQYI